VLLILTIFFFKRVSLAVTRAEEMGIQTVGTPKKTRPELNSNLHQRFAEQLPVGKHSVKEDGDAQEEEHKTTEDDNASMKTAHSVSKEEDQTEKIEVEYAVRQLNLVSETMTQVL
jgi:hypothetical protein